MVQEKEDVFTKRKQLACVQKAETEQEETVRVQQRVEHVFKEHGLLLSQGPEMCEA